jgi:hypothetical protein
VTDDDDPPDGRAPSWLYNQDYDDEPIFGVEPGAILCVIHECPGCGHAVAASPGETVTGCADHGGPDADHQ